MYAHQKQPVNQVDFNTTNTLNKQKWQLRRS